MITRSLVKSLVESLVKSLIVTDGIYPSGLILLYTPLVGAGKVSKVGAAPVYNYAGNMYDENGVSIGEFPAVHGTKGVWVGPGYTNLFTDVPPAPASFEDVVLTASNYALIMTGSGSVTCSEGGSADADNPLLWTSASGSIRFTVVGQVLTWQLTDDYIYPYVPPGVTVDSAVGTIDPYGLSFPLVEAEPLKEVYSGTALSVQLAGVIS